MSLFCIRDSRIANGQDLLKAFALKPMRFFWMGRESRACSPTGA
jgi:hypothetical protein